MFGLLLLNAFFVVANCALVRIQRSQIDETAGEDKNEEPTLFIRIMQSYDSYEEAARLGIALSTMLLGWVGLPVVQTLVDQFLLGYFPEWIILADLLSVLVALALLAVLYVVLGESLPRAFVLHRTQTAVLLMARPLVLFHNLFYPLIVGIHQLDHFVLQLLGCQKTREEELAHSEDELRMMVSASQREGVLDEVESELIGNVFDFADRLAREIMIPRQEMICLFADDPLEDNLKIVRQSSFTRYPLCIEDRDHVIGMVHIRDLMRLGEEETGTIDLRHLRREILLVPEGMPVAQLMQLMQQKKTHMAVVADEYGGTAGLVAMEDILEEIVGDIRDEHDADDDAEILELPDGTYEFDGRVLVDEVTELLSIAIENPEEDTLGGYIFGILGRTPVAGDSITAGGYRFVVLQMHERRVARVKASPLTTQKSTTEAQAG